MMNLRTSAAAASSLLLAACATMPLQQVSVSGAVPSGRSYAAVQPVKDVPLPPAWAGLDACLQGAGLQSVLPAAGAAPQLLAQTAYVLRPARAVVLPGAGDLPGQTSKPGRNRDREELVLTLTDRATGVVQWRGAVTRLLGKREVAGDGSGLVPALCAALRAPPVPAPTQG